VNDKIYSVINTKVYGYAPVVREYKKVKATDRQKIPKSYKKIT
jgi:hypothetical protein